MDRSSGGRRPGRYAAAAGWAAVIVVASLLPLPAHDRPYFGPYGPDRWLHLLGHAGLAAAVADAEADAGRPAPAAAAVALAASTLLGAVIEDLQAAVPGRGPDPGDVVVSAIGSLAGLALWWRGPHGGARRDP